MFCSSCGASVAQNAPYCSNCGRPAQNLSATAPPPPQGQYTGPAETDGKATGSLVLGILSLVGFSILAGIPAVILGHISRKSIRESTGRLRGEGMALAGLIMGYMSLAFIPIILIIAAIAIPNLLRARTRANEAAAASTVRTVNTAQLTYSVSYPSNGYAASLAALGPGGPAGCTQSTADHACLMDRVVAGPNCTAGTWCTKSGYRFSMTGICKQTICSDYVVVATPVNLSTGTKSYCSYADLIIRYKEGVLSQPLSTVDECNGWEPVL
jgi:type IV pilus assembly protein PilA